MRLTLAAGWIPLQGSGWPSAGHLPRRAFWPKGEGTATSSAQQTEARRMVWLGGAFGGFPPSLTLEPLSTTYLRGAHPAWLLTPVPWAATGRPGSLGPKSAVAPVGCLGCESQIVGRTPQF